MLKPGSLALAFGLALSALVGGACSGGYPLEPTPCDDLCEVTRGGVYCSSEYDPAGCVVACESQHLGIEPCRDELHSLLDCYRSSPTAASDACRYDQVLPTGCQVPRQWLEACVAANTMQQPRP
jgi:hypothetical protein